MVQRLLRVSDIGEMVIDTLKETFIFHTSIPWLYYLKWMDYNENVWLLYKKKKINDSFK